MNAAEKINLAFGRVYKALSLKPSMGLGTGVSKARITNGLACEVTEGEWKFLADMPVSVGGAATGPTPGVYGRAALTSCLAIGYMMRAAKMNVLITSLEVEVQADYDDGALFGTSNADPGYLEVRYAVTVESNAPEATILDLIDEADKHSPYLDVFSRGQKCIRQVNIVSPKNH